MTGDSLHSPLGRRLLAAFLIVALSSVVVLTVAALVATNQGVASAERAERQQVADRVAVAAASAYARAGGWAGADLTGASAIAEAAGARLVVLDTASMMVWPGRGLGLGGGGGMQAAAAVVESPVTVSGTPVGIVRLGFTTTTTTGRTVAWSWVVGAALVALATALLVSGYVLRRLTRPLTGMTQAARQFAAGDRAARAAVDAPGELGEMAVAFNRMADETVRTDRVRRQLAADVAHELRTPLAALQAGLEELRDGLRAPDRQRLGALHDQTLRLARTVRDLSDLAAAESAAVSLHAADIDLGQLAAAELAAHRARLEAAGLRISADLTASTPVRADPDRMHQVVANLLSNAARYCRPGDHVSLRAWTQNGTAILEVADTGPGVPGDELPHLFDRFWRGRNARTVTGSGIGLAVVRELVTAHGGAVSACSPAEGGTAITIRLPSATVATRAH